MGPSERPRPSEDDDGPPTRRDTPPICDPLHWETWQNDDERLTTPPAEVPDSDP